MANTGLLFGDGQHWFAVWRLIGRLRFEDSHPSSIGSGTIGVYSWLRRRLGCLSDASKAVLFFVFALGRLVFEDTAESIHTFIPLAVLPRIVPITVLHNNDTIMIIADHRTAHFVQSLSISKHTLQTLTKLLVRHCSWLIKLDKTTS